MRTRPRILFVTSLLPWPLVGGGQLKSYHTLRLLAERYDITLLALIRSPEETRHTEALAPLCVGGIHTALLTRSVFRELRAAVEALCTKRSFLLLRDHVAAVPTQLAALLAAHHYAALHIDHLTMMQFVPPETDQTRVVLDTHNVEYRIPLRFADTPGRGVLPVLRRYVGHLEAQRLKSFEQAAVRRADLTLTVSDEDRRALRELCLPEHRRMEAVPIGVDLDFFVPVERLPQSRTLLSIGTMFWPPNVDALLHFCDAILPRVRAQEPNARLNIVGSRPTAAIRALARDPKITVTGTVADVRDWASDCAAFIVPLRSGSGMRVKILNALAMGLPVVSTTLGAEGIAVANGENVLLADTPEAFADAVLRLLQDPALGARLGAAGRALVERRYGWAAIGRQLHAHYAEALAS